MPGIPLLSCSCSVSRLGCGGYPNRFPSHPASRAAILVGLAPTGHSVAAQQGSGEVSVVRSLLPSPLSFPASSCRSLGALCSFEDGQWKTQVETSENSLHPRYLATSIHLLPPPPFLNACGSSVLGLGTCRSSSPPGQSQEHHTLYESELSLPRAAGFPANPAAPSLIKTLNTL